MPVAVVTAVAGPASCGGAAGAAARNCAAGRTDCEGIQSRSTGARGIWRTEPTRTRRNSRRAGQLWMDVLFAKTEKVL
jgi:hypothetical protein